jgi:hypothetical protein
MNGQDKPPRKAAPTEAERDGEKRNGQAKSLSYCSGLPGPARAAERAVTAPPPQ